MISHPIQHFAPLLACLASEPGIKLKVFYFCDWGVKDYRDPGFGQTFKWDIPLLEGYEFEFLPIAKRPDDLGFFSIDNPTIPEHLDAFDAEAIWIHGYSHRSSWRAYLWAVGHKRDILFFGDSELLSPRSMLTKCLKRLILPAFFARCTAFLTIGDNNEAYYRHYGVPKSKMFRGSFPVDVARFKRALQMRKPVRDRERSQLGLSADALVALFVGKFINIKRPLDVLQAMHLLRDVLPDFQVLMLGSGPLEQTIRKEVERLDLKRRVILTGFVNQARIADLLRLGDFLIMSSEVDPHPLAVTEAMSVGNAIIASDRVGCVGKSDAARVGENALTYPCGNVEALVECILEFARDQNKLSQFQARSIALAETQDLSVMVGAVQRAMACQSLNNR